MSHTTIRLLSAHGGVSRWTIGRAIDAGELPVDRRGRSVLIPVAEAQDWLARRYPRAQVPEIPTKESTMPDPETLPALYSLEDIAERYGFSLHQLRRDARSRKFAYVRRGRKKYMTHEQVESLLAQHTITPDEAQRPADSYAPIRNRLARQAARRGST